MPPKLKLLVPVDGSDRSMNTVRYISKLDPFRRMRVIIFHVLSKMPDEFWDLETDPRSSSTVREIRAREVQQRRNIAQHIEIAHQFLLKSGFHSNIPLILAGRKPPGSHRNRGQKAKLRHHGDGQKRALTGSFFLYRTGDQ